MKRGAMAIAMGASTAMTLAIAGLLSPVDAAAKKNLCTPSEQRTLSRYYHNAISSLQVMAQPWTKNTCRWAVKYVSQTYKMVDWLEAHPECLRPGASKRDIANARAAIRRLERETKSNCKS